MTILSKIKNIAEKLFDLVGIRAIFQRKNGLQDLVFFDRNLLESYFQRHQFVENYYKGLRKGGMLHTDNLSKQFRFLSLQYLLEMVLKLSLPGDLAECGCWRGHSTFLILQLVQENHANDKVLHVFDSFEGGLSDKSDKDKNLRFNLSPAEERGEKLWFASTQDEVRRTLEGFSNFQFHPGWIPERFPDVQDKQFCFAHIDVDLYQPTLDSLRFFFPRLSSGGAIVIDDYGLSQFAGCKTAVDEFIKEVKPTFFYPLPSGGCFILK